MKHRTLLAILMIPVMLLAACGRAAPSPAAARPVEAKASPTPGQTDAMAGAFQTGQYPNLFKDLLGKSDAEVQARLDATWQQLFYGSDTTERVYYPVGDDMAYVKDIGNEDVRSEGMSYGMMIAVQLNKQEEFNRIWKWAKTYMYQTSEPFKGYFAWHCTEDGKQIDANPASDGEEWFVMALFFASGRWGDGQGIFNYRAEAQAILNTMLHTEDSQTQWATNLFNRDEKQVVFVPSRGYNTFTDPSYHLPAYYELWARWASQDQDFWQTAAQTSRAFFKKSANSQTGLMPDYANFDGSAHGTDDHKDFRFDAFRAGQNVAVDYAWFAADPWEVEQSNRLLAFFAGQGVDSYVNQYTLDGKPLSSDRSTGLVAMNAVVAMTATSDQRKAFVQALWDAPIPTGKWRYYDGLLYHMALLHLSGNFRIYTPQASSN